MSAKQIGKVVQCIGAVVDVEFPRDQLPKVYDALIIDDKDSSAEAGLTLEVQQQLGDGIVLEQLQWDHQTDYQGVPSLALRERRFRCQLVKEPSEELWMY